MGDDETTCNKTIAILEILQEQLQVIRTLIEPEVNYSVSLGDLEAKEGKE